MQPSGFHHNQWMVTLSHSNRGSFSTSGRWPRAAILAVTALIWAAAAACVLYWGLRLTASTAPTAAPPAPPVQFAADPQLVGRMLGAREASPAVQASLASRFNLQGVVAGGPLGGAALIAVDGKPARPFAVGSAVDEGLVLKSTSGRSVALAESRSSATLLTLEMPLLK
jgi:general secretion pathway protein C